MKLKTLKDIDIRNKDLGEYNRIGPTPFFHKKLRTEAIKWIKFNIKNKEKNLKTMPKVGNRIIENVNAQCDGAICWIKHFFNIKESKKK